MLPTPSPSAPPEPPSVESVLERLPERYHPIGRLGGGSTGTVFRVRDRLRGRDIALKVLSDASATGLLHLKREFRVLRGLAHEHLVLMLDLNATHRPPFLTMEIAEGQDFLSALSSASRASQRAAIAQLLAGLAALHRQDIVHRDVKPANVLVDRDGRVRIVDFGLAVSARPRALDRAGPAGTLAYLAPEVLFGGRPTAASDVFAAGVVAREVLEGSPTTARAAQARLHGKGRSAATLPGVEPELASVLDAMVQPAAAARPTAAEALARLAPGVGAMASSARSSPLAGRERELGQLLDAYRSSRGALVHVAIEGASGIGKTHLVEHFLGLTELRDAWMWRSRCHPHEETPFQALDGLIDDLATDLGTTELLREEERACAEVAQVFPVFDLLARRGPAEGAPSPAIARARVLRALRRVLRRAAEQRPIVIWIDDVQWIDRDGARLLEDVFAPPAPCAALLITTSRPTPRGFDPASRSGLRRELILGPLEPQAARELVHHALPRATTAELEELLDKAGGDPFELSRGAGYAVDDPCAREMLLRAALAGRPLEPSELAFRLELEDPLGTLQRLEGMRLLQRDSAGRFHPYHDRAIQRFLDEASDVQHRRAHASLADASIHHGAPAPAHVVRHLRMAGRADEMLPFAIRGAEQATLQLAFDRAAALLEIAVDLAPQDRALRWRLADALADAGRGRAAATLYRELAASETEHARRLEELACEQLLYSGHHEEGVEVARSVLARAGTRMPSSVLLAAAEILWIDRKREIRALAVAEPEATPAVPLDRLDALYTVALGLSFAQPIVSAALSYRHLLGALRVGEPARAARALGLYTVSTAFYRYEPERNRRGIEQARALAERSGSVEADALVRLASAGLAWGEGRFRECVEITKVDAGVLAEDAPGLRWHRDTWDLVYLEGCLCLGEHEAVAERLPEALADARARGDLHLEINLLARIAPPLWLALDRPDLARDALASVVERWPSTGAGTIELLTCLNASRVALYEDRPDWAWEVLARGWRAAERALLLTMSFHRLLVWPLRARVVLANRVAGACSAAKARKEVERALAELPRVGPVGEAEARALRAEVALLEGDRAEAARLVAEAATAYGDLAMGAHLAASRAVEAWLRGEPPAADIWDGCAVRAPAAYLRQLYPVASRLLVPREPVGADEVVEV